MATNSEEENYLLTDRSKKEIDVSNALLFMSSGLGINPWTESPLELSPVSTPCNISFETTSTLQEITMSSPSHSPMEFADSQANALDASDHHHPSQETPEASNQEPIRPVFEAPLSPSVDDAARILVRMLGIEMPEREANAADESIDVNNEPIALVESVNVEQQEKVQTNLHCTAMLEQLPTNADSLSRPHSSLLPATYNNLPANPDNVPLNPGIAQNSVLQEEHRPDNSISAEPTKRRAPNPIVTKPLKLRKYASLELRVAVAPKPRKRHTVKPINSERDGAGGSTDVEAGPSHVRPVERLHVDSIATHQGHSSPSSSPSSSPINLSQAQSTSSQPGIEQVVCQQQDQQQNQQQHQDNENNEGHENSIAASNLWSLLQTKCPASYSATVRAIIMEQDMTLQIRADALPTLMQELSEIPGTSSLIDDLRPLYAYLAVATKTTQNIQDDRMP